MFTEIRARGFKSWRELEPLTLSPVTGLFGANSSGKTSLLQLLLLLKQTTESSDRGQALNLGDKRDHVRLGSYSEILFHRDEEQELEIGLEWRPGAPVAAADPDTEGEELFRAAELGFQVRFARDRTGAPRVAGLEYRSEPAVVRLKQEGKRGEYQLSAEVNGDPAYLTRRRGRPWALPHPVKCYGFPDQTYGYFQNAGFVADLELAFEEQFKRTFYLGPLREYPQREYTWAGGEPADVGDRGAACIEALLASRGRKPSNFRRRDRRGRPLKKISVEQHVAEWLRDLELVERFDVEQVAPDTDIYRVWVQRKSDSTRVLLTDVGFGVSQILPVLVLLAYVPEGATVLLEQPEIHLHPRVQAGLADVIIETARERQVQVVIESHSEHLLRRFQRRVAEGETSANGIGLYFCEAEREESKIHDLRLNLFGEIENWPEDFFGDMLGETAAIASSALRRRLEQES